jgi:APA family basic amino acid/polyamine antiporter
MGFTFNLFTMLTVIGVIVLRVRRPDLPRPVRMWGYPYTAILFLLIGLWILIYGIAYQPVESLAGVGTVLTGLILLWVEKRKALRETH